MAFGYLILYCFIPALSTIMTFWDTAARPMWYWGIFINVVNCAYDAITRWNPDEPIKNRKLLSILIPSFIVGGYCLVQICYYLNTHQFIEKMDVFLYFYIVVIGIALIELIKCIEKDIIIKQATDDQGGN